MSDTTIVRRPLLALLLALCRRAAVEEVREHQLALLGEVSSLDELVALARAHGVLGLALARLHRLSAALPPDVAREVSASLALLRRQAILWDLERDRLLARLARSQLHPLVLKGAALRSTIYSDPAERTICDFDLLFLRPQVEQAMEVVLTAGYRNPWSPAEFATYRQHHFHFTLQHPDSFVVEIHWDLMPPMSAFRLDSRAFMDRSVSIRKRGQARFDMPCCEHMLLHMASQNVEDTFTRVRRLVDVDRILSAQPDIDWDYLTASAREGSLQVVLGLSLQLARVLLGTEVPRDVLKRMRPSGPTRFSLALANPTEHLLARGAQSRGALWRSLEFWTIGTWRGRLRHLRQRLRGTDTPLRWIAEGKSGPDEAPAALGTRLIKVGKWLLFEILSVLSGAVGLVTAAGRKRVGFWSADRYDGAHGGSNGVSRG